MPTAEPWRRIAVSRTIAAVVAVASTVAVSASLLLFAIAASAQADDPKAPDRLDHRESARRHEDPSAQRPETPPLPEGMSLDEVLERAGAPPPPDYPDPVPDDVPRFFTLIEQLEYRVQDQGPDELGWEAQGWLGYDYDRIWWKSEGENVFEGADEGESENDLLYARWITSFWNAQIGFQYANEWEGQDYRDRWSGALALQGLAPGRVEVDASLYISEDGDVTLEVEGEYNLRLTQRLVLQPRAELGFAAQDVSDRELGAGMTDANLDLRLRYEIRRELAPYIGARYRVLVGETRSRADADGRDEDLFFFVAGLRLAF